MPVINIARDFSAHPGGRHKKFGEGSGEEFRNRFLEKQLREGETIVVELDDVSGYPPSFLEEAFGGLIRLGFTEMQLKRHLQFKAGPAYEAYIGMIWEYISKEAARKNVHH